MSAFDAYRIYNALKLHFNTEKYDYFKYCGKVKVKVIPENQYYIFDKISKRYSDDIEKFYVANFLENNNLWVNDLLSDYCETKFSSWKKKNESLTYVFKSDIITLKDEFEDLNDVLRIDKEYPILMKKVMQEKISIETLLLTNSIVKFFNAWDKKMKGDLIWDPFSLKCKKYYNFLKFDQDSIKQILIREIKN